MDDRTLRDIVLNKLTVFNHRASNVAVAVESGVVSLYGEVPTNSNRLALEATCLQIPGVRAVVQHLRIRPAEPQTDDRRVALDAVAMLDGLKDLKDCRIGLVVADGVITLRGETETEHQRIVAEQCLRDVAGVANVHNLLALRLHVAKGDLVAWVREAIAGQDLPIREFAVEPIDGRGVRLLGRTDSWFAMDAAERAAWSAPGVRAVENLIELLDTAVDPEAEWSGMPEA
ncbi:MAG: BON domain-containing protein [Phenylobacterium sp.]|jgi:osmotically-inducible protein OsmY|uniref:BON domain-containing protein n=1 Tax=Phenylobacterium sp. TaxID=1871053 RepID=UPI002A368C20|nr:BON domain-containing protein [Phenylobacterium sp.]MDX9997116.1 BON domain-containing protein [Phenylobacterium sp.]